MLALPRDLPALETLKKTSIDVFPDHVHSAIFFRPVSTSKRHVPSFHPIPVLHSSRGDSRLLALVSGRPSTCSNCGFGLGTRIIDAISAFVILGHHGLSRRFLTRRRDTSVVECSQAPLSSRRALFPQSRQSRLRTRFGSDSERYRAPAKVCIT